MHQRLFSLLALCLLSAACGCASVPGKSSSIDAVATQMAINTKVALKKTAGPTLTAEAIGTSGPGTTGTAAPVATSSSEETPPIDLVMPLPPDDLDSYRLLEYTAWDGVDAEGEEVSSQVTTTIEFTREPPAMHMSVATDAQEMAEAMEMLGFEGDGIEVYMHEGSMYIWMFGGWMQMSLDALTMGFGLGELPFNSGEMDFSSTYTMTQWIKDATYLGQEAYQGQQTNHYALDNDSFDLAALPAGMEVEEVSGDLYAAIEGNYVVHMDMTLRGSNVTMPGQPDEALLSEGTLIYQSSFSAINESFSIELPEEVAEAAKPPEDIPVPKDARQVLGMNMFGASMFALLTEARPEEAIAFYRTEMPKFGWTEVPLREQDESEAMFSARYEKGEETILVQVDGDSMLGTSVTLSSGDPEQLFPFSAEP